MLRNTFVPQLAPRPKAGASLLAGPAPRFPWSGVTISHVDASTHNQLARPRTTHSKAQPLPAIATDTSTILARQRLSRPVAPHLGIYKWQITSVLSISTRITGLLMSGAFYAFGAAYLAAPSLGWDLSSAAMSAWAAGLPLWIKGPVKVGLAFPFVFHVLNGTRIFFFDMALGMRNMQVRRSGWVVVGLTSVVSVVLGTLF